MSSLQKILVLGSGGREHALCWHLKKSGVHVECAPGSDAIAELCPTWSFSNFEELRQQLRTKQIREVIVGPEKYLAEGVADFFAQSEVAVFGPTQVAAQLETDKAFAKNFLLRHKIPTAHSTTVRSENEVVSALEKFRPPYVVKGSGLAAGKGVWIGDDFAEAKIFATEALKTHTSVVIEEFLPGEELSYFVLIDGDCHLSLGAAQDHKRLLENDEGPNTGGMGAYSPVPLLSPAMQEKIESNVVEPTLRGLQKENIFYRGFLFVGLMIVRDEPYVLEFNCRMGDPETQSLMTRLRTPLPELIEALRANKSIVPQFFEGVSLGVVVAAEGYPDKPQKDFELSHLAEAPSSVILFHSGTTKKDGRWIAKGGRLFTATTLQPTLLDCQKQIYPWLEQITDGKNVTFRKDIGVKAYRHLVTH
jgi:phosphoribosylamine--glycine ligase